MSNNKLNIVVTGGAGFIGSHLIDRLLAEGHNVTNIDNFDPFYDDSIKRENIKGHLEFDTYTLHEVDIRHKEMLDKVILDETDVIVHLAAKAGVRPSIADPIAYQEVNVSGTQNLLELAKSKKIKQFVFASSSSVYGVNPRVPWNVTDKDLMPISPYASTKLSCEYLGHVYAKLYGIRFLALRFFTVYGPRQRPDLAIHKFLNMSAGGETIMLYGDGFTRRDYTYVQDIINGIFASIRYDETNFEILNLGNNHTIDLNSMVQMLQERVNHKIKTKYVDMVMGDVPQTWADITDSIKKIRYNPSTSFSEGLDEFVEWWKNKKIASNE